MKRLQATRIAVLLFVAGGLAVAAWTVGTTGLEPIVRIAQRLGIEGFAWYCCYSLAVFALVGGAWLVAAGEPIERLALFTGARLLREAAADLLPFSQIGGLVVGARLLTGRGVDATRVHASMIVDLATEIASQLVFTVFGLAGLAFVLGPDRLRPLVVPAAVGGAVLAASVAALVCAPVGLRFAALLIERIAPGGVAHAARVSDALRGLYRRRGRIAATFGLNLGAWTASACGACVVLRLMDVSLPLGTVVILESVIFLLRSVAFAIPGGIGVQEIGYLVVGPMVGLPADAALALAVAKRARDLTIGVPTLIVWQLVELRTIVDTRRGLSRPLQPLEE